MCVRIFTCADVTALPLVQSSIELLNPGNTIRILVSFSGFNDVTEIEFTKLALGLKVKVERTSGNGSEA